ncbi:hypothetical protein RB653_000870 [Dictyostelium firmibasis]|uniref:TPR repeat-containing protein n=1 Tax=Dictyostelium firmibasis TaxID=79012 RepID=A0AAN7YUQ8_9MYCE
MGCCGSKEKYNGGDVPKSQRLDNRPTNDVNGKQPQRQQPPNKRKNNTIRKAVPASQQNNPTSLFEITDLSLKNDIIEGLQEQPQDSDLLAQYGVLLSMEGKNKEAEESLKKAVEADSDNSRAWQAYGEFLERTNNPKKAKEIYGEAYKHAAPKIALDEDDSSLLLSYAIFIQKSGDIDKAEKLYKRIVTSGARSSNSLGRYGLFLMEVKKDVEKGGIYLKDAADIDPPSAEWCTRYSNYLKTYKKDEFEASKYQKRVSLYVN